MGESIVERMEIKVTAITSGAGIKPEDIKATHVGCGGDIKILDPGIHFVFDVSCKKCGRTARVEKDKLLSAAAKEGMSQIRASHFVIPEGRLDIMGMTPSSK